MSDITRKQILKWIDQDLNKLKRVKNEEERLELIDAIAYWRAKLIKHNRLNN